MTFTVQFFAAAVLLLCVPLPYSLGRGESYVGRGRAVTPTMLGVCCSWQNWVDLIRSLVGAWLLLDDKSIVIDSSDGGAVASAFYIRAAILAGSVLIHSIRFGGGISVYAPLFFLSGLAVFVPGAGQTSLRAGDINLGSKEGWFAVLFAWVFAAGVRNPLYLLPVMAVSLAAAGYFLSGMSLKLQLGLGLILLPLLLALLTQRRPHIVSKERSILKIRHAKSAGSNAAQKSAAGPVQSSGNILK